MDQIIAKGLTFYGCHGVLEAEKQNPQKFVVDLILYQDLHRAANEDDLKFTINYDKIFHDVRKIVEKESYNLIETLAEKIAGFILSHYTANRVEVTVYKPQAPVEGQFQYFAVKIERSLK